ncbi:hypothetical protein ACXR2T_10030 [Leucobacter sp. HY1910]
MSNINRHSAGAKQAGQSVGGQFAASQKTEASGAGLAGPAVSPARAAILSAIAADCNRQIIENGEKQLKLEYQRSRLSTEALSAEVQLALLRDNGPRVDRAILEDSDDVPGRLSFAGLVRENGDVLRREELGHETFERLHAHVESYDFQEHATQYDSDPNPLSYDKYLALDAETPLPDVDIHPPLPESSQWALDQINARGHVTVDADTLRHYAEENFLLANNLKYLETARLAGSARRAEAVLYTITRQVEVPERIKQAGIRLPRAWEFMGSSEKDEWQRRKIAQLDARESRP